MGDLGLRTYVTVRSGLVSWRSWANERGEGVISAAIAVLVMAFLGAGMWIAFNTIFKNTTTSTCEQTAKIGGQQASGGDCSNLGER